MFFLPQILGFIGIVVITVSGMMFIIGGVVDLFQKRFYASKIALKIFGVGVGLIILSVVLTAIFSAFGWIHFQDTRNIS